jgi:predicted acylesterase/phospholipase RssA
MRTYKHNNVYVSSKVNDAMVEHQEQVTISLTALATSAAPTFFPEVYFPEKANAKLVFWDGGLLNNNPIDQLWNSRYELEAPEEPAPPISCVISLVTGYVKPDSPSDSWFKLAGVASSVMNFATNTTAKGRDFTRHMSHMNKRSEHKDTKYIRLNPSLGTQEIGLADYRKMKELQDMAAKYVEDPRNKQWIDMAVDAICA